METGNTLKTPEEMAAYFRAMPKKKRENPYWGYEEETNRILDRKGDGLLNLDLSANLFRIVRKFFRLYYESFHSEAQVLFVTPSDGVNLMDKGMPFLGRGILGSYPVMVLVPPQDNHVGTSVISEAFWQTYIVDAGIVPVARMHSHHIMAPYQSATDYASLNSGTLELVMGWIDKEPLNLCVWLDVPGTDQKRHTFRAKEADGIFFWEPYRLPFPLGDEE